MNHLRLGMGLAVVVAAMGCRSMNKPASASFASVMITGHTAEEIRDATVAVFAEDDYKVASSQPSNLVFEKEGTRMNQIAFGTWMNQGVWVRVKAQVAHRNGGQYRLQCQTYMVRDYGGGIFEEEQPLRDLRGRPYQKLLDKVAERLKAPTNPEKENTK